MSNESPPLKHVRMPEVWRHASWNATSGLITSPRSNALPDMSSFKKEDYDYTKPRQLEDHEIYLAFFPVTQQTEGDLLNSLEVSDQRLYKKIVASKSRPGFYHLDSEISAKWHELEDILIVVSTRLYTEHPHIHDFPPVSHPRWPQKYGYRQYHSSKETAFTAARRSRDAFQYLSAFVTFAFSLWLGDYVDDCLARAISFLSESVADALPPTFLDLLKDSVICHFSPGLRPGAFVDPYTTRWHTMYHYFTKASVPIWFLWGPEGEDILPVDKYMHSFYYPPPEVLEAVKKRANYVAKISLPTGPTLLPSTLAPNITVDAPAMNGWDANSDSGSDYGSDYGGEYGGSGDYGTEAVSQASEDVERAHVAGAASVARGELSDAVKAQRRAMVNPDAFQRPGETHDELFCRFERQSEEQLAKETATERNSRLQKLEANKTHYTNGSPVFYWEQDEVDPSFYRRRLLKKAEIEAYWRNSLRWQRRYWTHNNQWDICSWMTSPPPDYKEPAIWDPADDSDDEDGEPYGFMQPLKPVGPSSEKEELRQFASKEVSTLAKDTVRRVLEWSAPPPTPSDFPFETLCNHLKSRYGFNVDNRAAFTHGVEDGEDLTAAFRDALKRLIYSKATSDLLPTNSDAQVSIMAFAGTLPGEKLHDLYDVMAPAWDFRSNFDSFSPLHPVQRVTYVGGGDLYILRPSADPSPWSVATTSSTVILPVFRRGWKTTHDIARGLLKLGIRFHTVKEQDKKMDEVDAQRWIPRAIGLGSRSAAFKPQEEDYRAYLTARERVLSGARGRAVRLAGGIAGRIASETVEDVRVLSGPVLGDAVIGFSEEKTFVDDDLFNHDLDVVCGVYFVLRAESSGRSEPAKRVSDWLD